ncbi:uncharacterized protein [Zea mays]|uniref:Tetraspanin-18 n=1 Tax=Zea mays TaxID=4577 RepID=A0A804LIN4_MAIZE|nr:uncharacterized protein LOC100191953 isoform X1 [Zea mays]
MVRRQSREGRGLGWPACCLGFLLKLLAFLQAFAAVSALIYAAWILSRWARHHQLHLRDLLSPDLWFPSLVMAAGIFYCLLLLAGYLAAEINTGCCLCFYTIPAMAMMLLEAALAAHLALNQHWIQRTAPASSTTYSPLSTITSTYANGLLLPSSPRRHSRFSWL